MIFKEKETRLHMLRDVSLFELFKYEKRLYMKIPEFVSISGNHKNTYNVINFGIQYYDYLPANTQVIAYQSTISLEEMR